jgi:Holliday junction resolvasome RuvABC endonuclease subunit
VRVLGLDLSVRATGICLPDGALSTFTPTRNDDWRLVEIRNHVIGLVRAHRVDLVMIEGPYIARQTTAAMVLAGLHYVVRVALLSNSTPYLCPAPALLKTYALGKGSGPGTDKLAVVKALLTRTRGEVDPDDDNQADAWWLRAMGMDLAGHPLIPMPATHRRAIDNLRLPAALQPQET